MSRDVRLSAIVITLNEQERLPGLLSRLDWVDEVIVVDSGSRDKTVEIARQAGCRVSVRRFDDYASQRNYASDLANGEWVLSVDADERPSRDMSGEVRQRIVTSREAAFRVPIRSRIFGRRLRFCGTQDDRPIRLIRRGRARWIGPVHETVRVSGSVGCLKHGLDHQTLPDLPSFLTKMNCYTALEAEALLVAGKPPRDGDSWLAPVVEVTRRLIWKQGCFDGPEGWAFCALSGLSKWVLASRHRRLWSARYKSRVLRDSRDSRLSSGVPAAVA
jgi:glycosyltransferase involved in cell wall biosynthesis